MSDPGKLGRFGSWIDLAGFLFLAGLLTVPAWSQSAVQEPDPSPEPSDPAVAIQADQAAVASEIAALPAQPAEPATVKRRELLERLDHTLAQHLNEVRRSENLALQAERANQAMQEDPTAALGEPPTDLEVYDRAEAEVERAEVELAQLELAVETARTSLTNARSELERREQKRRRAKEEGLPDLERLELRSRIAKALIGLSERELANATTELEIQSKRTQRALAVAEWSREHLVLRPQDARRAQTVYDRDEAALRRSLERAELDLQESAARWKAAQERIGRGKGAEEAGELALLRSALSLRQTRVALLGEEIDRLGAVRDILRKRLAVLSASPPERRELRSWLAEARTNLEALERDRSLDAAEITALEQELQELEKRSETSGGPALLAAQTRVLKEQLDLHRANLASLDAARSTQRRLVGELERRVGSLTLRDRVAKSLEQLRAAWSYELFVSGDQPVTLGKMLIAISLIVVGLFAARSVSRLSELRVLPRFGFDAGASHAFASLGFYALLVIVFLLSLRTVNIPLTAFALLGGALAIGVGFGSQNVVNNFISGIILLAERPIKIGDLVQVEETYGNVERIGLRSTRVRTGENIHFILPNSTLLENRVVNWTHNDTKVRIKLSVGIVYGAPTRKAADLLRQAISEHPRVHPKPDPIILFKDFGDNSLDFDAHFWVSVRSFMERLSIESDLRFRIDDLFREAQIVIAFPQRDVHLDSNAPLDIRLVGADGASAKGGV